MKLGPQLCPDKDTVSVIMEKGRNTIFCGAFVVLSFFHKLV